MLACAIKGYADEAKRTRLKSRCEINDVDLPQRFLCRAQHRMAKDAMLREAGSNHRLVIGNARERQAIERLNNAGVRILGKRGPKLPDRLCRLAPHDGHIPACLPDLDVGADDARYPLDKPVSGVKLPSPSIVEQKVVEGGAIGRVALDDFLENTQPLAPAAQRVVSERRPVRRIAHRRIQIESFLKRL